MPKGIVGPPIKREWEPRGTVWSWKGESVDPAVRRHGTVNMYVNQKCRCLECREAWRVYYHERRAKAT